MQLLTGEEQETIALSPGPLEKTGLGTRLQKLMINSVWPNSLCLAYFQMTTHSTLDVHDSNLLLARYVR